MALVTGKKQHDRIAEISSKRFDREVSKELIRGLNITATQLGAYQEQPVGVDRLIDLDLLPFEVFLYNVDLKGSALKKSPKRSTEFYQYLALRLDRHVETVVIFRRDGELAVAYNMSEFSSVGNYLPYFHNKEKGFYIGGLADLLAAIEAFRTLSKSPGETPSSRPKRFARISADALNRIKKLTATDWNVYTMMCLESNYNNRTCRRGQRKLAELCGLNQPQVSVSIKHLTAVGLVKLKQAGNYPHVAIYSLPLPPQAFNFIDLSAAVLDILRGLGRREWAVYVALRSLISFKTRQGKVSQTKLAELSRVHRSHIPLTVSHLEKAKLIQVDRQKQGKTFQYTLPAESWPCPSSTTPKNRSTVLQKPAEPLGDYSPSTKVDIFAQFR